MIRVDGHLDTPIYRWPRAIGITLCLLSPVTYGLEVARFRAFGRFRVVVRLLRWIGPIWFLGVGAVSFLFAMGVRMALLARVVELEIEPDGFALTDRLGRREFLDEQVVALGFRTRSVLDGVAVVHRGDATLWLESREGEEKVNLSWRFADGEANPLGEWLHRLLDQIHARASKEIDGGGTLRGDGWELSRDGLSRGDNAYDRLPFEEIAAVEYHDGSLGVWEDGRVEPTFRIVEGSKDDAILHGLLVERVSTDRGLVDPLEPPGSPMGRLLFERRATVSARISTWLICGLIAFSLFVELGMQGPRARARPRRPIPPPALVVVCLLVFLPALNRQLSSFRFHDRGVSKSGLLGTRALPFEDLAEVKAVPVPTGSRWRITFEPIRGRGRMPVVLVTTFADEALATIWRYAPVAKDRV